MQVEDISLSFKQNKTSYDRIVLPGKLHILTKEVIIPMDKNSLSHTRWNCKYNIVFAPKYRRQIIYGRLKHRKKYKENSRIYQKSIERRLYSRPNKFKRVYRSFYWKKE